MKSLLTYLLRYATFVTKGVISMSAPIRIDDELYNQAKRSAAAESRTVPLQIAYWAKIGKAALDNPYLPIEFIRDVLIAKQLDEREPFEFKE